jgi:hypothetical protein
MKNKATRRVLPPLMTAILLLLGFAQAAAAAAPETYYMFVFSDPVAGQESEYNRWYDQEHAPDVVSVPGFKSAQRYVLADEQLRGIAIAMPKYLVIYRIVTDDLAAVMAEVTRRVQSGQTRVSPTFDRHTADMYVYEALGPYIKGAAGVPVGARSGTPQKFVQFVLTVPKDRQEAEFNRWYDQRHAPEMASTPGFTSAQRLILQSSASSHIEATKYAALFEMESTDLTALLAPFHAPRAAVPPSPAFDAEKTRGYTYRALGPEIQGDIIRAQRSAIHP